MKYLALLSSPLLPDVFPATNHVSNAFPKECIEVASNIFSLVVIGAEDLKLILQVLALISFFSSKA